MEGSAEVFDNPFGDPPEAEADDVGGSTVYVRVPPALKRTIDQAAASAKLSTNAWAKTCMERCLNDSYDGKKAFSLAWTLAKHIPTEHEEAGMAYTPEQLYAFADISELLEQGAKALWSTNDYSKVWDVVFSSEWERLRVGAAARGVSRRAGYVNMPGSNPRGNWTIGTRF